MKLFVHNGIVVHHYKDKVADTGHHGYLGTFTTSNNVKRIYDHLIYNVNFYIRMKEKSECSDYDILNYIDSETDKTLIQEYINAFRKDCVFSPYLANMDEVILRYDGKVFEATKYKTFIDIKQLTLEYVQRHASFDGYYFPDYNLYLSHKNVAEALMWYEQHKDEGIYPSY